MFSIRFQTLRLRFDTVFGFDQHGSRNPRPSTPPWPGMPFPARKIGDVERPAPAANSDAVTEYKRRPSPLKLDDHRFDAIGTMTISWVAEQNTPDRQQRQLLQVRLRTQ
jgi:hypothetical protein